MIASKRFLLALLYLLSANEGACFSQSASNSRRDAIAFAVNSVAFLTLAPKIAAAEDNVVLSDEEMAAKIARKQALKNKAPVGMDKLPTSAADIRSDINPEAGVNLRGKSLSENAKATIAAQKELKNRDKSQKREDLCEMLGRGC